MGNPLNSGQQQNQMPDFNQLYQQFLHNPMQYLIGLNLPQNIQTAEQAVRYLADNGQIPPLIQKQVYAMLGKR